MNHPHAGCACPREGNRGWQGRAEHDKAGAGMPQPWNDKVHAVRTRPGFQTFPRVRRDGRIGGGEGQNILREVAPMSSEVSVGYFAGPYG